MNDKEIDYNLLEVEKGNKRNGIYLKNHIQDQYKEKVRLQARIDKAIEKLKEHKQDLDYEPWSIYQIEGKILFDLVDILKGRDKE